MFRSAICGVASGRSLLLAFCVLVVGGTAVARTDAPPDAAEQEQMLKMMREYAASYKFPDMAYDQVFTFFRRTGPHNWRERRKIETQRIVHDGREYLCCRLDQHGRPIPNQWVQTWLVPGEGTFPWDGTSASVVWNRWDVVRGRRVAVFDYSVSQQDSHRIFPDFRDHSRIPRADGNLWSGPVTDLRGSTPMPYSGGIWIDPATGAIWRYSTLTRGAHPDSSNMTDYDFVKMGRSEYLLPVALVSTVEAIGERVDWVSRNFREFEADSTITFFTADSTITYPQ